MPSPQPSYPAQLGAVLRRRDPLALRQFLLDSARQFGAAEQIRDLEAKSPLELQELMHRMILARPDLRSLHRASETWLQRHGAALVVNDLEADEDDDDEEGEED